MDSSFVSKGLQAGAEGFQHHHQQPKFI